jgi:hypothetical protein
MTTIEPGPVDRRSRCAAVTLLAACLVLTPGCQSFTALFRERGEIKPADRTTAVNPPSGAPSKYSFRVAPYVFLYDSEEIRPDLPLFKELAGLRDQVYSELKLAPGTATIQVYLFSDRERYEAFMRARHPDLPSRRAFFIAQQRAIGGSDDLLVYTFWGDRIQQDLRHELTHALLHSVLKDVPLWLDEGLAEYFELPPDSRGVNRVHVDNLRRPGRPGKLDLARLESVREVKDMTAIEYREAWAWVHFLLRGPAEAKPVLLSYLAQLRHDANPPPLSPQLLRIFVRLNDLLERHLADLDDQRTRAERR